MLTAALLAVATLCWPISRARTRLNTLTAPRTPRRHRRPRLNTHVLTTACAATGWLVAALPGAIAATLATVTARRRWRSRTTIARSLTTTEALAEAIRSLVAALRAGAHPADAADSAAQDALPEAAAPLRALATAARLNGTPSPTLTARFAGISPSAASARFTGTSSPAASARFTGTPSSAGAAGFTGTPPPTAAAGFTGATARFNHASPSAATARSAGAPQSVASARFTGAPPSAATAVARISRAWSLSQHHGLPLADVLDTLVRDLDQRVRFTRQVQARLAGPRTSATVLALLPALGLIFGELMGAHPLHVLTSTTPGRLLLLTGVALICLGITWSAHLTHQAAPL
ncbi:hypothetical protein BLA60_25895 [Actinophytocola xinjiangensis]|uniref:Tight adherence protein B n=1 Tax=Actinophytocola xinjiangensis TaxID=485602 RepID=A0A7Z1AVW0_9PSEU|nr:hypothetical protein [Actinophytocola xinjiangensis]OLF07764.1 hypothetical protein BLA60_25895 [Actinophytocola xinjiangensis]